MAEAARELEFPEDYIHGSAAPAGAGYVTQGARPAQSPMAEEWIRQRERAREAAAAQYVPRVSLFAVFGSVFAAALMVFVVLAQISYNEIASETVKLNAQFAVLTEQQRRLEITFESVVDMKEIEQYARDVLGMSNPIGYQSAVIPGATQDRAEVLAIADRSTLRDFGSFISSLLDVFR